MPEYLAPGVYLEEVSFRSKSIEGVSTSTAGFIGPTRFGPVSGPPELIVSYSDFERYYGDMENLSFGVNYLALGVRSFFEEGGSRCYVMRVAKDAKASRVDIELDDGDNTTTTFLQARFPGIAGDIRVTFTLKVGDSILRQLKDNSNNVTSNTLSRIQKNDVVYLKFSGSRTNVFGTVAPANEEATQWIITDSNDATYSTDISATSPLPVDVQVHPVSVLVTIERPSSASLLGFGKPYTIGEYSLNPDRPNGLIKVFVQDPENRLDELTIPFAIITEADDGNTSTPPTIADYSGDMLILLATLVPVDSNDDPTDKKQPALTNFFKLTGGADGSAPMSPEYDGDEDEVRGFKAFEAVEDISIIAAPGYTAHGRDEDQRFGIHRSIISHCERMRYRIAVLDTPSDYLTTQALSFRNFTSSTHAAIYYPWVYVSDPRPTRPGEPVKRLKLPPSGFVAGIYARNDIQNAVFKAPANEVVREAIDFEQRLSKGHQEVLNPEGVNCFRFFEGRGMLLWGARTISDDPEWKYVSLRRYFAYLERSIERGTQWAVFENNGPQLWNNVRRTIDDFLLNEWVNGGLLGEKPEKAYFVRCDRSTMTQNDLDNGRLICLIGVAPVRPAEFVIFRIGQWTADS